VGRAIIKNKLFFFLDGERTKQDAFAAGRFDRYSVHKFHRRLQPALPRKRPLRQGRLQLRQRRQGVLPLLANSLFATFGFGFRVYDNKDYTRTHVVGVDFNTGSFSHSIRFSYLKFQNQIKDVTSGNSALPFSSTGLETGDTTESLFGPNLLAPQSTPPGES
jgi:hypothetical protein